MILLIWYINKLNVYVFIREERETVSAGQVKTHKRVCVRVCMCTCTHAPLLEYTYKD